MPIVSNKWYNEVKPILDYIVCPIGMIRAFLATWLCIKNHFQKIWPERTPTMGLMYYFCSMKKSLLLFSAMILFMLVYIGADAQCAMCTKTAQQLGEKPAQGMNSGILYLMLMPFAIIGFIGYRWWKNQSTN